MFDTKHSGGRAASRPRVSRSDRDRRPTAPLSPGRMRSRRSVLLVLAPDLLQQPLTELLELALEVLDGSVAALRVVARLLVAEIHGPDLRTRLCVVAHARDEPCIV